VKEEMGRRKIKPNYDVLVELLHQEEMSQEEQNRFIQKVLGVDSPREVVLKLMKTEEQRRELLEFLQRGSDEV
jgi:hypothetical protein